MLPIASATMTFRLLVAIATILTCYSGSSQVMGFLVPSYAVDGCACAPLIVTAPGTGFSITKETCGILVPKETFNDQPFVYFQDADESRDYTIVMVDPDAPLTPAGTYYLHWIIANVPGYILKTGLGYNIGTTIKDYIPPTPPECSGAHRYILLAFEQRTLPRNIPVPFSRSAFSLANWLRSIDPPAALYGPVASIQFLSNY